MTLNMFEEIEETPEQAMNKRQLTAWAKDCTAGDRDPFTGLTDCEARVLAALRALNYEIAQDNRFARYIRRAA